MKELEILPKGTLKCPICKNSLHFEVIGSMRIISNDKYSAYCPKDNKYFDVATDGSLVNQNGHVHHVKPKRKK
jgi:hypothetical protein